MPRNGADVPHPGHRLVPAGDAKLAVNVLQVPFDGFGRQAERAGQGRHQGLGIGRRLLESLLDFAGDGVVYLEVRTDNAAAIALYESAGFETMGIRKRYYRVSGADAFTMRREAR